VPGRPGLRSVDSECAGRVMEPRNSKNVARADAVLEAEGSTPEPKHGQALGSAGVKERGTCTRGWPRNLGGPDDSTTRDRWASGEQPRPEGDGRPPPSVSETRVAVVPRWRGNEAGREGRQGVGVPRCTWEAGERSLRGPCGGKGAPEHGTEGGKDGGDAEPYNRINETPTDSDAGVANP